MSLEKLQQEAEELKSLDLTKLPPEQLSQLVEKLTSMLDKSETLLSTFKIEMYGSPIAVACSLGVNVFSGLGFLVFLGLELSSLGGTGLGSNFFFSNPKRFFILSNIYVCIK